MTGQTFWSIVGLPRQYRPIDAESGRVSCAQSGFQYERGMRCFCTVARRRHCWDASWFSPVR